MSGTRRSSTVHVLQVNARAGERLAQCDELDSWQRMMRRAAALVVTEHVLTRARRLRLSEAERDTDLRGLLDALGLLGDEDGED